MIGPRPSGSGLSARSRFHQGWWRAFVLCEEPGLHPSDSERTICSSILNGEESGANFLTPRIQEAIRQTLEERDGGGSGIILADRLYNNMLSSQPLAFNFFGELKLDPYFAARILGALIPGVTRVSSTCFEFAPPANYSADNSAFDVAFEIEAGQRKGLFGLECKYTDTFSQDVYDKPQYRELFDSSRAFTVEYDKVIASEFNQLFRNQLLAEAAVLNGEYDFALTALFCHPDDQHAIATASEFRSFLRDGEDKFRIITYWDLIECIQRADVSREQREYSMLLWARYLGGPLSDRAFSRVG